MPSLITWTPFSRRGGSFFLAAVAVFILTRFATTAAPAPAVPFSRERILIIPKAGREAQLANQHATERVKIKKKFPALGNIHILELPPGSDPEKVVERYRRQGDVETADLDYRGWQPAAVPNDPAFLSDTLWHLNNTGFISGSVPDADIDAPEAWDIMNSASNIIVADLDTGARVTHEDIAPNLWINPGEIPGNGIDDDNNGIIDDVNGMSSLSHGILSGDLTDGCPHGTGVIGILGAAGNNGVGICGVAWKVKIMPLRFIDSGCGGNDDDLMTCLDYARAHGAKVVNCSIVSGVTTATISNAFWSLQQADILVCAAAGNGNFDNDITPTYPASYKMSNVVSVTSTLWNDVQYNHYGANSVHLAAPGLSIYTTTSTTDNSYDYGSGTSYAAPMVSGAAALLRAKFTNETSAQIIRRILNGVDVLPGLAGRVITSGRLNLRRALDTASLPPFTMTNAAYAWVPTNGMTRTNMPFSDSVGGPLPLPFAFPFYGRSYTQIWVSANGLLGVTNSALSSMSPGLIPGTNIPNAIYPFWDDLNPPGGGGVWWGITGVAPNRKFVASWVGVPHMMAIGGPFTFQAVLHESGQIAFQYQEVQLGNTIYAKGKHATIGIEEPSGLFGTRYRDAANPSLLVTNNQAILFTPEVLTHPAPGLRLASGPAAGQIQLTLSGEPAQPAAILFSTNLSAGWSMVYSNVLPASGLAAFTETNASPQKFYRALSGPFLP
jgi:subtilisin family serine protease